MTYTLIAQGGDVAGGGHGVQYRPSSQSFSGRHEIRDRGKTRSGRPNASVQPLSGIPGRDFFPAAGAARQTQIGASGTTRPPIAFAQPLTHRSARDLVTGEVVSRVMDRVTGWVRGQLLQVAPSRALALSANGLVRRSIEDPGTQKPQPPVGWGWRAIGQSPFALCLIALRHMSRVVPGQRPGRLGVPVGH